MTALAAASAWHGRLDLRFERRGAGTRLAHAYARMPLAVQRPFYPEGDGVCHVVMLHPPGGMVGGDRLDINVELADGSEALLTTPSAAKWYRANGPASQAVHARVGHGAHFEWLPLETIVFDGARARQTLKVELAPGASFLGWEITRFGRTHGGETFASGEWRAATEVWREGRPLWIDRQQLVGGSALLSSAYGLAGQPVAGGLVCLGHAFEAGFAEQLRALPGAAEGDSGVTRLADGLLCRYRGRSSSAARDWFGALWNAIRHHTRNRPAQPPRIWQT